MNKILFLFSLFFATTSFAYSPPKWTEKERKTFIKECTKLGNTERYCICFSTFLEETESPKKMLHLLKGESTLKEEAHNECKFNNNLKSEKLKIESL